MSAERVLFLTIDDVLQMHAIAIADQGGDPALLNRGLLESALAMPQQQFGGAYLHDGIPAMAAAYAFHICKNHAFADGNKRSALAAMVGFLALNDWRLDASNEDAEEIILRLAAGSIDKNYLTDWTASHTHKKPSMELRHFFERFEPLGHFEHILAFNRGTLEEQLASIQEASRAMPVVAHLHNRVREREAAGDQSAASVFMAQVLLLVAVYRVAEDMGYEW
jgi:death on curing protein